MGLMALAGGVGFTVGSLPIAMMMAFGLPRVEETVYNGCSGDYWFEAYWLRLNK